LTAARDPLYACKGPALENEALDRFPLPALAVFVSADVRG
jgi:hypothetical protein